MHSYNDDSIQHLSMTQGNFALQTYDQRTSG
jgi:hypothetical protein